MSLPYRQWAAELNKLKVEMPRDNLAKLATRVATSAVNSLVEKSPVGNPSLWKSPPPPGYVPGAFKNSWVVEVGGITPAPARTPNASGSASLAETSKLAELAKNPYQVIYIHNSLPYAWRLEHGWSTQAPVGMVSVTLNSLSTGVL